MARPKKIVEEAEIFEGADPGLDAGDERARIQSLDRAFKILEEISRHQDGIGLADLAKNVGIHNSTTYHLVRTMVGLGYVRQSQATKRYHIGRMIFTMAATALNEVELVSLATPIMEELARATGETTHLAVRVGDEIVVVARIHGPGSFQMADRSLVRPAHATALGKVLLSGMPAAQRARFLQRHPLAPFTEKTVTDPARLEDEIQNIQRTGIAFDDGEFDPEVRCLAVPIHDFRRQITAALGFSGPVWRMKLQTLHDRTADIREAARTLSAALGFPGDADGTGSA